MRVITSLVKQVKREHLKTEYKGVYAFSTSFYATEGEVNYLAGISFSPIYFISPPLVYTNGIPVRIITWQKHGNAIVGAVIHLTGYLEYDTMISIVFEGRGGV